MVGPAPRVDLPRLVGEDHLTGTGMLALAGERAGLLSPDRTPDLEIAGDCGDVKDRHLDGEGHRNGITDVDQGVQPWQAALLAEPPQQRLRSAPILSRLQPHPGKSAPPCP